MYSEEPAKCHHLNLTCVPQMPLITQRTQLCTTSKLARGGHVCVELGFRVSGPPSVVPEGRSPPGRLTKLMKLRVSCNYTSSGAVWDAGSRLGVLVHTGPNEASHVLQPRPCDLINPQLRVPQSRMMKEETSTRPGEQQQPYGGGTILTPF